MAKIYFLKGEQRNLKRLKDVLCVFINSIQFLKDFKWINPQKQHFKLDPRYINFLASIYKNGNIFPDNIKVLSWNYDFQLQMAAHLIRPDESLPKSSASTIKIRKPPLFEYYPATQNIEYIENELKLVHLNGNATIFITSAIEFIVSIINIKVKWI